MKRLLLLFVTLVLLLPAAARAHVGSKDVFETVKSGPYTLNVTIRPPDVIPGIATVEIRTGGAPVSALSIAPVPLTGEASKHPPTPDVMKQSAADPNFYTGGIWIMAAGTWQVLVQVDGPAGREHASVPLLAVPVALLHMSPAMGWSLAALGLFLIVSMAGVIAASVRDARLRPGTHATPVLERRGLVAAGISLAVMTAIVGLGAKWWNVEAASYAGNIFRPATTTATLSGDVLDLHVKRFVPDEDSPSRYLRERANDDYIPDHGRLMHLYAIREPEMDAVFHLHPTLVGKGDFRLNLPASVPPGHYRLYGDVVHRNGFPETLVTTVDVPAGSSQMAGPALDGDDAEALPTPLSAGDLGSWFRLPDGYTMVWDRPATLSASTPYSFHFRLLDPVGKPAANMQPYLGMAGHAAFVKTDGSTFAHTHPEGSAAMADVMLATPGQGMEAPGPIAPEVDFPYGFPKPGRYRIFIQMKHDTTVETGAFDAEVH